MEENREQKIRLWFAMWLQAKDLGMEDLFAPDCIYIESWGPKYEGRDKVSLWFREWTPGGGVVRGDLAQFFHPGPQTVGEGACRTAINDGSVEEFHGLSLVRWDGEDRIVFLQEFGCNIHNYDPYAAGETPVFRDEPSVWF